MAGSKSGALNILFVNLSALRFTVATPDTAPLGGSESAVAYLARALAQRGHRVSLVAYLPQGAEQRLHAVDHYALETLKDPAFFATHAFDVIILCNAPAAVEPLRALSPASRLVLWAHVLPDQPSLQVLAQPQAQRALDATVFVSAWQQGEVERVFGLFTNSAVIGNGIAPAFENMFASVDDLRQAKQNRAAYTTTPYRGLSVLLRAMQGFESETALDLFSSMQVYQAGDDDYANLFAQAAQDPRIVTHGVVAQGDLAASLRRCAFLFYPCIYPETFCITAAEAMAAGMHVVSTHLGALPETTMGFADLVPLVSRDGDVLVQHFRAAMQKAVGFYQQHPEDWAQGVYAQSQRVNEFYNWRVRAAAWENLLERL